jgi:hypothetical protein
VAKIGGLQRGRVSRRQLLQAGVGPNAITHLLAKGQLHREHPGVYAVWHGAPIPLARETAALLACRDGAVLSHRSAAMLWGLTREADEVDVTVAGGQRKAKGVNVHRTAS